MAAEPGPPPARVPEERAPRVPRWLVVLAVLALATVVGVIVYGYLVQPGWIGVSGKKFWDYLELLIVPAALALVVFGLNRAQSARDREAEDAQQERERKAEEERRERERIAQAAQRERELDVEDQRAQDAALQAYLDQMSQLLLDKDEPLRQSKADSEARTLARARTLTVLTRLDDGRKRSVAQQFLYQSGLITKDRVVVDLRGADLSGAHLSGAHLGWADLSSVDLSGADLQGADLQGADLSSVDLSYADLRKTVLYKANLNWADLSRADLSGAHLSGAHLSGAHLSGADLSGATGITNEELDQQASYLEGATMPTGQKYEDWLKSKSGED